MARAAHSAVETTADRSVYTAAPLVLTLEEVLRQVPDLSYSKLYAELKSGRLISAKIGKRRYVRPRDLDAWIESHITDQGPATDPPPRRRRRKVEPAEVAEAPPPRRPRKKAAPAKPAEVTKAAPRRRGPNRKSVQGQK